jgi:hypothetical protein
MSNIELFLQEMTFQTKQLEAQNLKLINSTDLLVTTHLRTAL